MFKVISCIPTSSPYVYIHTGMKLEFKENDSSIEYEIIGEGSQISTNQKPGNSAFSLLIG